MPPTLKSSLVLPSFGSSNKLMQACNQFSNPSTRRNWLKAMGCGQFSNRHVKLFAGCMQGVESLASHALGTVHDKDKAPATGIRAAKERHLSSRSGGADRTSGAFQSCWIHIVDPRQAIRKLACAEVVTRQARIHLGKVPTWKLDLGEFDGLAQDVPIQCGARLRHGTGRLQHVLLIQVVHRLAAG